MKATVEERAFDDGTVYEIVVTSNEETWSFDTDHPVTDDDIAVFKAAKKWFDKQAGNADERPAGSTRHRAEEAWRLSRVLTDLIRDELEADRRRARRDKITWSGFVALVALATLAFWLNALGVFS